MPININNRNNSISSGNGAENPGSRISFIDVGSIKIPTGANSDRPSIPVQGDLRYNTDVDSIEMFDGLDWNGVLDSNFSISMSDINDALITSPVDGDVLIYDTSNWINKQISGEGSLDKDGIFTLATSLTKTLSITGQLNVDNLRLDGNTLSSTNTNGDIIISTNGNGIVLAKSGYNMASASAEAFATKGYVDTLISTGVHYRGTITDPTASTQGGATAYGGTIINGDLFRITTAGIAGTFLNGLTGENLDIGDYVIFNGSTWELMDSNDPSVQGTIDRISVDYTPASEEYVIDIDSNYVGQNSITTLGTITTGTWNADVIEIEFGGTGLNTIPARSILVANSLDLFEPVQAPTGSGNYFLQWNDSSGEFDYVTASTIVGTNYGTVIGDSGSTTAANSGDTITIIGATNGGIITAVTTDQLTIAIDVNDLTAASADAASGDTFSGYDSSASGTRKFSLSELSNGVNTTLNLSGTYQPLDADLTAIAALSSTGFAVRTGSNTWAQRTIVASGVGSRLGIDILNTTGVSGNVTIGLNIATTTASGSDLSGTDLFIGYNGSSNVVFSGTQLADGIQTLLGDPTAIRDLTVDPTAEVETSTQQVAVRVNPDAGNLLDFTLFAPIVSSTGAGALVITNTIGSVILQAVDDTLSSSGSTDLQLGAGDTGSIHMNNPTYQSMTANTFNIVKHGTYVLTADTANSNATKLVGHTLTVSDFSTWFFEINIVGRRGSGDATGSYVLKGVVTRNSGAATIVLSNQFVQEVYNETDVGWDANVEANTTTGELDIIVNGDFADNVRWAAVAKTIEVYY